MEPIILFAWSGPQGVAGPQGAATHASTSLKSLEHGSDGLSLTLPFHLAPHMVILHSPTLLALGLEADPSSGRAN
jgi:hypothetical protein